MGATTKLFLCLCATYAQKVEAETLGVIDGNCHLRLNQLCAVTVLCTRSPHWAC